MDFIIQFCDFHFGAGGCGGWHGGSGEGGGEGVRTKNLNTKILVVRCNY